MATELEINLTDDQMQALQWFAQSRDTGPHQIAKDLLVQSLLDSFMQALPTRSSGLVIPFQKREQA